MLKVPFDRGYVYIYLKELSKAKIVKILISGNKEWRNKYKQLVVTFYKESDRITAAPVWGVTALAIILYLPVGSQS